MIMINRACAYSSSCLTVVIVLRCFKCPRLPEEARKKKEREIRRQGMEGDGTNPQLNSTDGHAVVHVRSPFEGNVDQPLDPPGNVDLPISPPAASQEVNVVYNPSARHTPSRHNPSAGYRPPSARHSRYSHEPSDSVELRYIRSRTTSEVRDSLRDSYYHENTGAHAELSPSHNHQPNGNSSTQLSPIMSTSTRI